MKATITQITLKSPLHFFALANTARVILKQLKQSNCLKFQKTGFWTQHYTMTLWQSEEDLKAFAHSGAHMEAMKRSASIAKNIKTLTIDAKSLPNWDKAKAQLAVVPGTNY